MERSAKIAATSSRAVPGLLSEVADASGSRATVMLHEGREVGRRRRRWQRRRYRRLRRRWRARVAGPQGSSGVGELVLQGHKGRRRSSSATRLPSPSASCHFVRKQPNRLRPTVAATRGGTARVSSAAPRWGRIPKAQRRSQASPSRPTGRRRIIHPAKERARSLGGHSPQSEPTHDRRVLH